MSSNEITGDSLHTGGATDAYRDGWDRIFGKKKQLTPVFTLPKAAFFLECVERERGWGAKIDGYLAFASKEQAEAYRKDQYADRKAGVVPDYYVNYEDAGWHPISEKHALSLMTRSDAPYLYFDNIKDAV